MNVILTNQPPIQPLNISFEGVRVAYTNPPLMSQDKDIRHAEMLCKLIVLSVIKGTRFSHDHREPWFGSMDGLVLAWNAAPYEPVRVGRKNLFKFTDQEIARELGYILGDNFLILKYVKEIRALRNSKVKRFFRKLYMIYEDVYNFFYIIIG
jgi:hypothetical protein